MELEEAKVELPAEQLKKFYDSEQWKLVVECLKRVWKVIRETITLVIEAYKVYPEIKKCCGIYKITKSRRIKKKQITRINKLIRRIIYGKNK